MLNLSENLIRFRKERKLTQSDVAQHLGITKASVSKWETGQTMPDVALLPLIASFYGVTLDELMGYEPMLTNQQIQAIYERFTSRFASESFDSIFTDIQIEIRRYYSCCPFLYQMAVLLLNHCNPKIITKEEPDKISRIQKFIVSLCMEVEKKSNDPVLRENACSIRMMTSLQAGNYEAVIDGLSDLLLPDRVGGQEALLVTAYMAKGETEKADQAAQIILYRHLLLLIQQSMQRMILHTHNPKQLKKIIHRTDILIETYHLMHLHPNTAAGYYYHSAICMSGLISDFSEEEILSRIEKYCRAIILLFRDNIQIHGDEYFPYITEWFSNNVLGNVSVRHKKEVMESALEAFDHPVLQNLNLEKLREMKTTLIKECEFYVRT